ncbi:MULTISPECIES: YceI family protein [unclassified Lysobacter]|uniref:YceI family protein n=1 Tax=unclassified Lysobacter TaxID=2635362 RepID=UPI001BE7A343|nr:MULTISPECIES: YceI family protein [unclassified Lysobacter]MBT2745113.1 polyisoprenoid-binding protein [Lysobacter sp. ISL-42]MBT2750960.1 polyisoprenoid-binding protein [Lysobacter sp. ISL-50]MBT2778027.1 polyisoprenoid-binding protein [Lysobacter sp. ISL-54]MBT2783915.1 polyisoprenoid-binding protein [Lysobacter sp. ISL-52]
MSLIHRCATALAVLCALPAAARAAQPETYGFDPVHTRVMFAISHAGFSQAIGTVSGSAGTLSFDRNDWRGARLEVQVPLTRLDLGDGKWNQAALAANLLDGKRYPLARFVSERVEPVAGEADRAQVCGQLTLHGVTAPLCMDVKLNQLKRHPLPPFHRTAGFSATARLSRAAFGIDAWKSVIGDEVELRIEAEAIRDKYVGDQPKATPGDPAAAPEEPVDSTDPTDPAKPQPEPSR